jgi:hypothetical protein
MRYFSTLIVFYIGSSLAAYGQSNNTDALKAISDTADRVCGIVGASGESQSSKVSGEINAELAGLLKKLSEFGVKGTGSFESSNYTGVLQGDLASVLANQRDCKLKIFASLVDKFIVPIDVKPPKTCRVLEGYRRELDVTRESGWRGGGYDPTRWCNDLIAILAGENPQGNFAILNKSESQKNTCAPFNCPQYNYLCTVHVKSDPIYKEISSPSCP